MGDERPVTRGEFESLVSAVRRAIAANQAGAPVPFADTVLVLGRTDDGGFTLRSPGADEPMALFPEPSALPRTYPPDLPFAVGEFVTTGHSDGALTAMWWAPRSAEQLLEELHEQSVGRGWVLKDELRIPEQAVVQRSYVKDDVRRFIATSPGSITLIDRQSAHGSTRTRSN